MSLRCEISKLVPAPWGRWAVGLALATLAATQTLDAQVPTGSGATSRGGILSVAPLGIGSQGAAALVALGVPAGPGEVVVRAGVTFGGGEDGVVDFGVLYGMRVVAGSPWLRYAGGLGVLSGGGLAGLAQLDGVISLTDRFGIGVGIHGALGRKSYVGASFGVYLGWPGYQTTGT